MVTYLLYLLFISLPAHAQQSFIVLTDNHFPFASQKAGAVNDIMSSFNKWQKDFYVKFEVLPYKRANKKMLISPNHAVVATSKTLYKDKKMTHLPITHLPMVLTHSKKSKSDKEVTIGFISGEEKLDVSTLRTKLKSNFQSFYLRSYDSIFRMLNHNRLTYGFCGLMVYENLKKQQPNLMKDIQIKLITTDLYAGLTVNTEMNKKFIKSFSLFMQEFTKSDKYRSIISKYFQHQKQSHIIKDWFSITTSVDNPHYVQ